MGRGPYNDLTTIVKEAGGDFKCRLVKNNVEGVR